MTDRIRLPGPRDVRGSLDGTGDARAVVVACPPHPQLGGDRTDSRLRAVSDALVARDLDCLRIDYGPWDEGRGEQTDVQNALRWALDRYERAGLFGYSFGGGVALLATANAFETVENGPEPVALSVLAPPATIDDQDVAPAVEVIDCPFQVVYGERDGKVDSVPVAERAREHGGSVEALPADHFFVGQRDRVGRLVAVFLDGHL